MARDSLLELVLFYPAVSITHWSLHDDLLKATAIKVPWPFENNLLVKYQKLYPNFYLPNLFSLNLQSIFLVQGMLQLSTASSVLQAMKHAVTMKLLSS